MTVVELADSIETLPQHSEFTRAQVMLTSLVISVHLLQLKILLLVLSKSTSVQQFAQFVYCVGRPLSFLNVEPLVPLVPPVDALL